MHLYLIRHGESVFNAAGRIQGQLDVALSAVGQEQARRLALALAEASIEAIFASPLLRATETARPLADKLRLDVRFDDRLREIHAGIFQGLCWSEIDQRHPEAARAWRSQDPDYVVPEGESRRALMARGAEVLREIRRTPFQRVAVVSHGGLLSAALKALLQIPAEAAPFSFRNAAISELEWGEQLRLLTLNDAHHLRQPLADVDAFASDATL